MAQDDAAGLCPLDLVEANFSRLSSSGERHLSPSQEDFDAGRLASSSPLRSHASKHGPQLPPRSPGYSASELAYLNENSSADANASSANTANEDGTQDEDGMPDHEAGNQLNQSVHEQSEEEEQDLDSSLASMTTVGTITERQEDLSFGDEESDPEDDPSGGQGQGNGVASKSVHEEATEKTDVVAPPLNDFPADLFIPEELKGEIEIGLPNDIFNRDLVEWKLPKQPWCQQEKPGQGWTFWLKPLGRTITPSARLLKEKVVNGKTLVALTEEGRSIPMLLEAFEKLPEPQKPCIFDSEERQWRKKTIMRFLATEHSTCNAALGDWEIDKEKDGAISIGKLPLILKQLADGDRPARQVSPPPSFTFSGAADSEAQGFHDAVYGDAKHLTDYLG